MARLDVSDISFEKMRDHDRFRRVDPTYIVLF